MAIFDFHIITTLIGASILSKVVSHFSFTRLLYNGLIRSVVPSDQELMESAGHHRLKLKGKKRRLDDVGGNTDHVFYFPRSVPIQLKQTNISHRDVILLPLYSSCQWLLDFTICALGVYAVNEFTYNLVIPYFTAHSDVNRTNNAPQDLSKPKDDAVTSSIVHLFSANRLNLSIVWLVLTVWFVMRTLISMTSIYFRSSNDSPPTNTTTATNNSTALVSDTSPSSNVSADWLLVLSAAFFFFIFAGFSMLLDQKYLDFRLIDAHSNLTLVILDNISEGKEGSSHSNPPLISWGAFQFLLALTAAFIGALYVYPGLKCGRLYLDAIKNGSLSAFQRLLLHLAFLAPLLPILLWVLPVTRHLSNGLLVIATSRLYQRVPHLHVLSALAADMLHEDLSGLHSFRVLTYLLVVLLRVWTVRCSLQVYLNSAQIKLTHFGREPGRTSNHEVQRLVASVFHCINLVALQCLAPSILQLSLVCLLKTCSGRPWLPTTEHTMPTLAQPLPRADGLSFVDAVGSTNWSLAGLLQARSVFSQVADSYLYRGSLVARGVYGFLAWWSLVAWQVTCLVGLAYHRMVTE